MQTIRGLSQPLFKETTEQAVPLNAVLFRSKQQHNLFAPEKENRLVTLSTQPSSVSKESKKPVKRRQKAKRKPADASMFTIL